MIAKDKLPPDGGYKSSTKHPCEVGEEFATPGSFKSFCYSCIIVIASVYLYVVGWAEGSLKDVARQQQV